MGSRSRSAHASERTRLPSRGVNVALPSADAWSDRYLLEEAIGTGAMGTVFRARDRSTGARVAIKRLKSLDPDDLRRFEREFEILSELSHPAIVPCLGAGRSANGEPYFAMKWLDGESLRERLRRAELTLGETLSLVRRVLSGLGCAHERGVVHRDVKPANVFLEDADPARAVVLDFGIARGAGVGDTITRTGQMIGTPGYASPEQVQGLPLDARSDVYAVGCLLFRCLAGRLPFEGADVIDLLTRVAREEAPPLAELRPDLPSALTALVDRALAREGVDRPADAGELALDLDRVCARELAPGAPLLSRRPSASTFGAPSRGESGAKTAQPMSAKAQQIADGSVFAERYCVLRFVARGGFGDVYEARHLVLDTVVAIKIMRPDRLRRGDLKTSAFLGEARLLARLRHPHIVAVLDAGVTPDEGLPWMALEWCSGDTLESLLASGRILAPMPARGAWTLLRPAVEAIAHAHTQGIAHRDFKPSNVMMVREGAEYAPRVVDFGLAKLVEGATPAGDTLSEGSASFTPAYVAPEQAGGSASGPWTDVHAIGLVLTELITGKRAYPEGEALRAALDPHRPTPRALGGDLDDAVEEAIAGALAFNPVNRYGDATVLLARIDAALAHPEAPSRPDAVVPPVAIAPPAVLARPSPARRGRTLLLGVTVAVLVASGLAALGYAILQARPSASARSSSAAPVPSGRRIDRRTPPRYPGNEIVMDRRIPWFDAQTLDQSVKRAGFEILQTFAANPEHVTVSVTLYGECGGSVSYHQSTDPAAAARAAGELKASAPDSLVALQDNRWLVLSLYLATGPDPACNEALFDALCPR